MSAEQSAESAHKPCPSVARAILGAVDAPDGVLLRCGHRAGHDGFHRFLMEWSEPSPHGGRLVIADEIEGYLASRRRDPDFMRRVAERIERDAQILRRLAEDGRSRSEHSARTDHLRTTHRLARPEGPRMSDCRCPQIPHLTATPQEPDPSAAAVRGGA